MAVQFGDRRAAREGFWLRGTLFTLDVSTQLRDENLNAHYAIDFPRNGCG